MNDIGEAKLLQDRDEDVIFYTKLYIQKYFLSFYSMKSRKRPMHLAK